MPMIDWLVTEIGKLDWASTIPKIIVPILGAILMWWKGGFRWIFSKIRIRSSKRHYRKALRADVSFLPIIGRKEGFDLAKVYVQLDVAPSDLMTSNTGRNPYSPPRTFVLVGAPGAGKSTYVKRLVLTELQRGSPRIPFFFRLRDYDAEHSIEELLARKLEVYGVKDSEKLVQAELRGIRPICVLDGLDEVRPHLLQDAYDAINSFSKSYFGEQSQGVLVVTCRKEAYRSIPLSIPSIWEALPLKDTQIQAFAQNWPLVYPRGKNADEFWNELSASERILEVSRSPLLLVGSLLLYTESGLGIPGQRTKYLEKIRQTLIEDWSTVQGQPPDPLRDAYSPALTAIAYWMHTQATAELPRAQCIEILTGILPSVGIESDEADVFLDSMVRRTGILVRNAPGFVIFVHFTLQEYFVSLKLAASVEPSEIAGLEPKTWWREPILFVAAQKPDPTDLIQALFISSPLVGALAVTEAPTPSIALQRAAVELSLVQLDIGDSASVPVLIALTRKVAPKVADDLFDQLETRLDGADESKAINVSQILASAGTESATEALSRHPGAWQYCLRNPGSLSGKFERKLMEWVSTPDHPYWGDAAALFAQLPLAGDDAGLSTILDSLPSGRASELSTLLLERMYSEESQVHWRSGSMERLPSLCQALSHLDDPEKLVNLLRAQGDGDDPVPRWNGPGLVLTTLYLAERARAQNKEVNRWIFEHVRNATLWSRHGSQFMLLLASNVLAIGWLIFQDIKAVILVALFTIAIIIVFQLRGVIPAPWLQDRMIRWTQGSSMRTAFLLLVGATMALSLYSSPDILLMPHSPDPIISLSSSFALVILALLQNSSRYAHHPLFPAVPEKFLVRPLYIALSAWAATTLSGIGFLLLVEREQVWPIVAAAGLLAIWASYWITRMLRSWRALEGAALVARDAK